jgi:hypothetical protein
MSEVSTEPIYERKVVVTRDVGPDEVKWLRRTYKKGEQLYEFTGPTYSSINHANGMALSEKPGENPFFEFPYDAFEFAQ